MVGKGSAGGVPGVAKFQGLLAVSLFLQGAALALYQAATAIALRCAIALAPRQPATALALHLAATVLAPHNPATALALHQAVTALALHQAATALALRFATALAPHQPAAALALYQAAAALALRCAACMCLDQCWRNMIYSIMVFVHIAVQAMQTCLKKMESRLNQRFRTFWMTTELKTWLQPKQGELEAFQHALTHSTQSFGANSLQTEWSGGSSTLTLLSCCATATFA